MKTFREFIEEAYLIEKTFSSRAEAEKYHKENPPFGGEPYIIKQKSRAGEPEKWRPIRAGIRKKQEARRKQYFKPISDKEFLSHLNRNLEPNAKEVAAAAADFERQGKESKRQEAKRETDKTGEEYDLDHLQPQPTKRRPEYQPRFKKVLPGDSNANLRVLKHSPNTVKQDTPPKKGEPGHTLTRAGAIRSSIKGGKELLSNIDKVLTTIRANK